MEDLRDLLTSGVKCKGCGGLTSKHLPTCYRCGRKKDGTEVPLTAHEIEKLKQDLVKVQTVSPAADASSVEHTRSTLRRVSRGILWFSLGTGAVLLFLSFLSPPLLNWITLPILGLGVSLVLRLAAQPKRK